MADRLRARYGSHAHIITGDGTATSSSPPCSSARGKAHDAASRADARAAGSAVRTARHCGCSPRAGCSPAATGGVADRIGSTSATYNPVSRHAAGLVAPRRVQRCLRRHQGWRAALARHQGVKAPAGFVRCCMAADGSCRSSGHDRRAQIVSAVLLATSVIQVKLAGPYRQGVVEGGRRHRDDWLDDWCDWGGSTGRGQQGNRPCPGGPPSSSPSPCSCWRFLLSCGRAGRARQFARTRDWMNANSDDEGRPQPSSCLGSGTCWPDHALARVIRTPSLDLDVAVGRLAEFAGSARIAGDQVACVRTSSRAAVARHHDRCGLTCLRIGRRCNSQVGGCGPWPSPPLPTPR